MEATVTKRSLLLGVVLTLLFFGGWMVGGAEGPYLPLRALIAAVLFGLFGVLGNLAERRGWLDD